MKNKTCGECSWFSEGGNRCKLFINQYIFGNRLACNNFKQKPTNGDVIRQVGNRDFAEYFVYETGAVFASTLIVDKTFDTYEEATKATEDYLNAPAESEGKMSKKGVYVTYRGAVFEKIYTKLSFACPNCCFFDASDQTCFAPCGKFDDCACGRFYWVKRGENE